MRSTIQAITIQLVLEGLYGLGSLAEGEREGAGPAGAAASPLYK